MVKKTVTRAMQLAHRPMAIGLWASLTMPDTAWAAPSLGSYSSFVAFGLGVCTAAALVSGLHYKTKQGKNAKLTSKELENRLKALDEHSIVSITDANARIIEVNQKFIETLGYSSDELIGNETNLIYPECELDLYQEIKTTLAQGKTWAGEMQLKTKSGRPIWTQTTISPLFSADGRHVSSISVRTDISKIKQAQSEQDMRCTLHMLRDEVYVFDAETQRFTYMNQAAMDRHGWNEAEYKVKTPADAIPGYSPDEFHKRAQPLLNGEHQQLTYQVNVGDTPLEIRLQQSTSKDGRVQFVAFANDISERLVHEQAKNDFVSTVSHELRSPLTSIKGGLGLVLSGATGNLSDKSRSLLEIAHRNSDRLVLLINDILDLEKIASGQRQLEIAPTDIRTLIQDAATANEAFCSQYGVCIRVVSENRPYIVECDSGQIFQILNNLISNAAKFSKSEDEIVVSLAADGPDTLISVRDYGVGIPADAQATIFDRFTQVPGQDRKAKGGTGLGLSIVKAIAEQHQGTVTLESSEGAGTTFTVRLPTRSDAGGTLPHSVDMLDAAQ
ncbi:PAS domain-containing sensor histidine kinase [Litoreibacter janthinus]|uniref:histidine kinase n=1 Tax=Litoreibacter janthinus TaxID=670154 RepID=A0A1I6FRT8_9RHOB|nr:ATP-binding protein [Litoreibacter janthinus]SFR32665.1 PAS domain S-box-containing protein [Litoreibacter janthinus]